MRILEKNPDLIAMKREFGRKECERILANAKEAKERKAKLIKAVRTLFTPAPVLRFA